MGKRDIWHLLGCGSSYLAGVAKAPRTGNGQRVDSNKPETLACEVGPAAVAVGRAMAQAGAQDSAPHRLHHSAPGPQQRRAVQPSPWRVASCAQASPRSSSASADMSAGPHLRLGFFFCRDLPAQTRIVFVTSEVAPFSKTGGRKHVASCRKTQGHGRFLVPRSSFLFLRAGLGEAMDGLPIALAALGHRVMVVSPRRSARLKHLKH